MVMPHVNSQHHQHMFCARLDMAVDDPNGGKDAVVTEVRGHVDIYVEGVAAGMGMVCWWGGT